MGRKPTKNTANAIFQFFLNTNRRDKITIKNMLSNLTAPNKAVHNSNFKTCFLVNPNLKLPVR